MKVPVLNQYTSRYLDNDPESYGNTGSVTKSKKVKEDSLANSASLESGSSDNLISRRERDFFIRMFPENSEQLERHVVFNRNGKIQSTTTMKGTLIDGRI